MPYIIQSKRDALDEQIRALVNALRGLEADDEKNNFEGNVNYAISTLLSQVYQGGGYRSVNDAIGVLECIKLEFYRKVAAPYEEQKEFENGSVYSKYE